MRRRLLSSLSILVLLVGLTGCRQQIAVRPDEGGAPQPTTGAPQGEGGDGGTADEAPDPQPDTDTGGGKAYPPCSEATVATIEAMVEALEQELAENDVPGGAVAVVCGGAPVVVRGMGVTHAGGSAVNADTRFQIASATKMFTAAAGAVLHAEGVVDLDAPISDLLGEVAYGHATLRDLLSHRSGFPTAFNNYFSDLAPLIDANAEMTLWAEPGTIWDYSNPGFSVAGRALEVATSMSFAELMETYVLGPADLSATLVMSEVTAGDFARGHTNDPAYSSGPLGVYDSYYHTGYYGPMGGIWASANDLEKWAVLHINDDGEALPEGLFASLRTPQSRTTFGSSYGLGMFIDDTWSPTLYEHGGSVVGFLTEFQVVPNAGFAVALVVNSDQYFPSEFAYNLRDAVIEQSWTPGTSPEGPAVWPDYVGRYLGTELFGTVDVVQEGSELKLVSVDTNDEAVLNFIYGDSYEAQFKGEQIDVNFWRAAPDGPVTHLVSLYGVAERTD